MAALRRDPKLTLAIGDSLTYQGITLNTGNGPAREDHDRPGRAGAPGLRAWRIDRKAIIDVVFDGLFTPTVQANPPILAILSSPTLQPPARDVAKAKALLQQAGVPLPVQGRRWSRRTARICNRSTR